MKGLSKKEIEIVSYLELHKMRFFTRESIQKFFKNSHEMSVCLNILKNKKKVIRINKNKYYLVPITAYKDSWTEHSFILVDEIMNGKDYFIGGKSAAHFWHIIDQIPFRTDVFTTKKQGLKRMFSNEIYFRRVRKINNSDYALRYIKGHPFNIAKKKVSEKWI